MGKLKTKSADSLMPLSSVFTGGKNISAVEQGDWTTDIAILCDNAILGGNVEITVKAMYKHEFTIYDDKT